VIATGANLDVSAALAQITAELPCKLEQEVSRGTTHVLVATDSRGYAESRTARYLLGLARSLWVVSPRWVADSAAAGRWLDERPYEVRGDKFCAGGAAASRRRSAPGGRPLFSGLRFRFAAESFAGPSHLEALGAVLEAAGGSLVRREDQPLRGPPGELVFLAGSAGVLEDVLARGPRPVLFHWVIDSLSAGQQLPRGPYLLGPPDR